VLASRSDFTHQDGLPVAWVPVQMIDDQMYMVFISLMAVYSRVSKYMILDSYARAKATGNPPNYAD